MLHDWYNAIREFAVEWGWYLFGFSAFAFATTLMFVPIIVVRLPVDFLRRSEHRAARDASRNTWLGGLLWIGRNVLGGVLLVGGFIMLFTPGQGLLSILTGLLLLDFPGKRRLLRRLLGQPRVLSVMNALRRRWQRAPLLPPHRPLRKKRKER